MNEKPVPHGRFEAAEEILAGNKSLEELMTFRELMLEHLHIFEAKLQYTDDHPVIIGFRLLIGATEARIRFKEFLASEGMEKPES